MSSELSSGSNPTTPSLTTGKSKGEDGPAPKAQPEDTSDVGLGEDGMPLNPGNPGEQTVQFIAGQDPANGDAKVDIGDSHGAPKFVGLGKEELMKYANDPFWVRLRWILFILFWLIWLAMLIGAIVIIMYAPKCSEKYEGTTNGPYYQIYLDSFAENGLLKNVDSEIEYLAKLGVKAVIISQVLKTDTEDLRVSGPTRVTDFKDVSSRHGNLNDFKDLVTRLKDKDIKVTLQIIPNHSSQKHPWFQNNKDFYVLQDTSVANSSTWKSRTNADDSAWTEVPGNSDKSYLHQFQQDEPDLNYGNSDVIKEMRDVLEFWYNTGISGFLLSDVSYLWEDLSKLNDLKATINQAKNLDIIDSLLDSSKWNVTGDKPFALLDLNNVAIDKSIAYYKEHIAPVSTGLADLKVNFTVRELQKVLEDTDKLISFKNPVHWRLSGPRLDRPARKFGSQEKADALALVTFMLRGQVILYYGDEYGINPDPIEGLDKSRERFELNKAERSDRSRTEFYTKLIQLHDSMNQTELGGGGTTYHTDNGKEGSDVFVMKRTTGPDFIVVANFGSTEQVANIREFRGDASVTFVATTLNVDKYKTGESTTSDELTLPLNSGIILELPKKKE